MANKLRAERKSRLRVVVSIGLVRQAHTQETQTAMRSDARSPIKEKREKIIHLNPYKARCTGLCSHRTAGTNKVTYGIPSDIPKEKFSW